MLIKRTERQARRGALAQALPGQSEAGLDRRSFLRRSGLVAGGLAALGDAAARQRPQGGSRSAGRSPAPRSPSARTSARTARSAARSIAEVSEGVWIGQEPGWESPINRGSHCAKGAAVRELVHGDRRLKYPMKLVNGQWTKISWDTAINEIGDKLHRDPREVGTGLGLLARLGEVLQRGRLSQPQVRGLLGHQQRPTTRRASAIRPPSPASPIPGATAR